MTGHCERPVRVYSHTPTHRPHPPSTHLTPPHPTSFIAFTNSSYNKLLPTVSSTLKELGFTAGSSDGVDLPYFKAFRIGTSVSPSVDHIR